MTFYYDGKNKTFAQTLRKNLTKEERHLWYDFLRDHTVQFRRQKQFGPYIVDFYSSSAKLVVELDGSEHYESDAVQYDKKRTEYLEGLGLRVIRFTNTDVSRNFSGVCEAINQCLE